MLEVFVHQIFQEKRHQKVGIENFLKGNFLKNFFKICKCAIGGMLQLNFIYRMCKITSQSYVSSDCCKCVKSLHLQYMWFTRVYFCDAVPWPAAALATDQLAPTVQPRAASCKPYA